jgi:hypothetical protein
MARRSKKTTWHPVVEEVLHLLTRPEGPPTIDEQMYWIARIATLPKRDKERVESQLSLITQRLVQAGHKAEARLIASLGYLVAEQDGVEHVARRVFS